MRTGHEDSANVNASDVGNQPRLRRTLQTAHEISPQAEVHTARLRSTVGVLMHARTALAVLIVTFASGCKIHWYTCLNPDEGHRDALGNLDPCHENDADAGAPSDAGDTDDAFPGGSCYGTCVPTPPGGWAGPALLWTGDEINAPSCSEVPRAPAVAYTGHADPSDGPYACGACTCDPPTGSCWLPATLTASSSICSAAGGEQTSFNPPSSWDGSCTASNLVPAGKLCKGVPCVQSVTIASLEPIDKCKPIAAPAPIQPPRTWKTFARACFNAAYPPPCTTDGEACVAAIPGPDFKQCIFRAGEPDSSHLSCPPTYPDRSVFYEGAVPTCTPCECTKPSGSTCSGSIGLFSDAACGVPLIGPTYMLDALGPKCVDVPLGSALGSKSSSIPIYSPGVCTASGGEPMIEPSPNAATVFCCQDPQHPNPP